ncbi:MAG: hypothetical protein M5T61_10425 [Acidimicrobiia bacterium]|nr:hypothetical protein [Acidimicrobiia bacterium]
MGEFAPVDATDRRCDPVQDLGADVGEGAEHRPPVHGADRIGDPTDDRVGNLAPVDRPELLDDRLRDLFDPVGDLAQRLVDPPLPEQVRDVADPVHRTVSPTGGSRRSHRLS